MMSNILEKTLGSIFSSSSDAYVGLQGLYKQCIGAKTKKEEGLIIQHYLSILRDRLKEPGIKPNFVGHCMGFVIFCDLLGHRAEFAHIHAINLSQQSSLPEKKMGYAASCCLLKDGDDLSLLLVNTLVRDMSSSNVAVLALALSALCSAPLPSDAIPSILPALRDRLSHQTAYVRCRAVTAVHHILKKHPSQCGPIVSNLVSKLGDEDPHVVTRVLATLPDVIQVSPESVSGLVSPLVAIQRQILRGRLPDDLVYQSLPAPWAQLNIIRVLPELALSEEEESAAREVLLETLTAASVKEGQNFEPPLRAALVSQSVAALMSLESPSEGSKARAMTHVSSMLASTSSDVKHEGLQLLGLILARYETTLSPDQKVAVTSSLDHPDVTVKRRALALLAAGAGAADVQTVCGQLFSHASTADHHLRDWLLEQAVSLIGRFCSTVSPDWQLSALVKLLPLAEEPHMSRDIMTSCRQVLLGDSLKAETRGKLLGVLEEHAQAKQAPTCLLTLYIWTLGHFPELTDDVFSKLITLGNKIARNSGDERGDLLLCVVQACSRACEHHNVTPSQQLPLFLNQIKIFSSDLGAACSELQASLPYLTKLRAILSSAPREVTPLDCTLTALDQFVSEKLKNGECRVYNPQMAASLLQSRVRSPEMRPISLDIPSPPLMNISQNSNSVPSEDSWSVKSLTSPQEALSPDAPPKSLVWGRQGRLSNPETSSASTATTLAMALSGSTQVARNSQVDITNDDPLGDLLR